MQNFEKKQAKKGVCRHFLENFEQESAFFRRALPPENYILGSVSQKWISQNITKGEGVFAPLNPPLAVILWPVPKRSRIQV